MAFSLDTLLNPPTEAEWLDEFKTFLTANGLDTTSWKEGDPEQTLLQLSARFSYFNGLRAQAVVKGTLNDLASGEALTRLSDSHFDNQRFESQKTEGLVVLELDTTQASGFTFGINDLIIDEGTYQFTNTVTGSVSPLQTFVTMSFQALEPGSEYNVGADRTWSLVTARPGVTATNPIPEGATTWITTVGTDEESDPRLKLRNSSKWATLGTAENSVDRVEQLALSASTAIESVYTDHNHPRGPGTVDVYLAGATGSIGLADIAAASYAVTSSFFGAGTGRIQCLAATVVPFTSSVNVYHAPSYDSNDLQTIVEAEMDGFIADAPIGGVTYEAAVREHVVSVNELIARIEGIEGVRSVKVTPSGYTLPDVQLTVAPPVVQKLVKPAEGWGTYITMTRMLT
jgi:hypothetical protein